MRVEIPLLYPVMAHLNRKNPAASELRHKMERGHLDIREIGAAEVTGLIEIDFDGELHRTVLYGDDAYVAVRRDGVEVTAQNIQQAYQALMDSWEAEGGVLKGDHDTFALLGVPGDELTEWSGSGGAVHYVAKFDDKRWMVEKAIGSIKETRARIRSRLLLIDGHLHEAGLWPGLRCQLRNGRIFIEDLSHYSEQTALSFTGRGQIWTSPAGFLRIIEAGWTSPNDVRLEGAAVQMLRGEEHADDLKDAFLTAWKAISFEKIFSRRHFHHHGFDQAFDLPKPDSGPQPSMDEVEGHLRRLAEARLPPDLKIRPEEREAFGEASRLAALALELTSRAWNTPEPNKHWSYTARPNRQAESPAGPPPTAIQERRNIIDAAVRQATPGDTLKVEMPFFYRASGMRASSGMREKFLRLGYAPLEIAPLTPGDVTGSMRIETAGGSTLTCRTTEKTLWTPVSMDQMATAAAVVGRAEAIRRFWDEGAAVPSHSVSDLIGVENGNGADDALDRMQDIEYAAIEDPKAEREADAVKWFGERLALIEDAVVTKAHYPVLKVEIPEDGVLEIVSVKSATKAEASKAISEDMLCDPTFVIELMEAGWRIKGGLSIDAPAEEALRHIRGSASERRITSAWDQLVANGKALAKASPVRWGRDIDEELVKLSDEPGEFMDLDEKVARIRDYAATPIPKGVAPDDSMRRLAMVITAAYATTAGPAPGA